jgi:hypothetical protein
MASHDHIDPNTEEEERKSTASIDQIEKLKLQKDILWGLFEEHRAHARHTETLRSTVNSMLIVASAVLVTLATYDRKLNLGDIPAALLLIGFGLLGTMFSLYHTEKILKHKTMAREYRNELDEKVVGHLNGERLEDIRDRVTGKLTVASKFAAANRFASLVVKRLEEMGAPSSLILWIVLPLFISFIGGALLAFIFV